MIILYCQNLPPEIRWKRENTIIIGTTPPPGPGTKYKMHEVLPNVMTPIIETLLKYNRPPYALVPTYNNSGGELIQVKIAPVTGDTPARHDMTGFMHHSANYFCAFCLCTKDQMDDLQIKDWVMRDGDRVAEQARLWKAADQDEDERSRLEKENSVRWSSLYNLAEWDPVSHTILGFMHNWSGILKEHLRTYWGLRRSKKVDKQLVADQIVDQTEDEEDEIVFEKDIQESGSELDDLLVPLDEHERRYIDRVSATTLSTVYEETEASDDTPRARHSSPLAQHPSSQSEDDDIEFFDAATKLYSLPKANVAAIHDAIAAVGLPSWVGRPLGNIVDPGHGKLKSNDYFVLFTAILPLIVPEFFFCSDEPDTTSAHLSCFHDLIVSTNIVSSYQTSFELANNYMLAYVRYRRYIGCLYPQWNSVPNHHYAMHNGDIMKFWGPLPCSAEFWGERVIGLLENTKTNNLFRKSSHWTYYHRNQINGESR